MSKRALTELRSIKPPDCESGLEKFQNKINDYESPKGYLRENPIPGGRACFARQRRSSGPGANHLAIPTKGHWFYARHSRSVSMQTGAASFLFSCSRPISNSV